MSGKVPSVPAASIRAAESLVGTLPPSYRWWLTEYGSGTSAGARIATVAPPGTRSDGDDDITGGWRLDGDRLCFCAEPDGGDTYHFALDRQSGEEYAVVRRDPGSGQEELVADTFAGFLTTQVAVSNGLGTGPTSALARLWRSTPGVLLPNGVLIYGPHSILERNETYQVGEYAPDWVLIGDDSGGSGLFMRRHPCDRTSVYLLDLGSRRAGHRQLWRERKADRRPPRLATAQRDPRGAREHRRRRRILSARSDREALDRQLPTGRMSVA